MHVRLKDYLQHPQFGILESDYYQRAILHITRTRRFKEIWVISDDCELAKHRLGNISLLHSDEFQVTWLETESMTSFETLQIMRNASGYVLSNSTFGWWGALLSKYSSPEVVVPFPWFAARPDPENMHPNNWVRLSR